MKKIDFKNIILKLKNKKTLWRLISILILILLVVFIFRGSSDKAKKVSDNNLIDIANSEDYIKYKGFVKAQFEGEHKLDFSFIHKKTENIKQGIGNQSRWFMLNNDKNINDVTLYFTYEGGRGFSVDDYINEYLNTNDTVVIQDVKFADQNDTNIKYIIDTKNNVEYYIQEVKGVDGDSWLAIVENNAANNEISKTSAKDLIRSLEIASKEEVKEEVSVPINNIEEVATTTA